MFVCNADHCLWLFLPQISAALLPEYLSCSRWRRARTRCSSGTTRSANRTVRSGRKSRGRLRWRQRRRRRRVDRRFSSRRATRARDEKSSLKKWECRSSATTATTATLTSKALTLTVTVTQTLTVTPTRARGPKCDAVDAKTILRFPFGLRSCQVRTRNPRVVTAQASF